MTQTRKVDVIVVGAGASGAIVASELAQNGARVVCMDKGPRYSDDDFRLKFDEIRYYARGAIVPHMTTDPMTWRERPGETSALLPWVDGPLGTANPLHLPPSLGTGGGSIHWGGACWRFREAEFRMRSLIEERLGADALPANHTVVDWPIGYKDLESYYDRVEWELGISGRGNVIVDGSGAGGQSLGGAAPTRLPDAAVATGAGRSALLRCLCAARLPPVQDRGRDCIRTV